MHFSENSRVWIYQSDRKLTDLETQEIEAKLQAFVSEWTAHTMQLAAGAEIRYNRFLILIVDESKAGASGCSIDKSVKFMKELEQEYGINLFDRFNLAYKEGEEVFSAPRNAFEELIKQSSITAHTIVFNNLVQSVAELNTKWEVPFSQSWHPQLFRDLITA